MKNLKDDNIIGFTKVLTGQSRQYITHLTETPPTTGFPLESFVVHEDANALQSAYEKAHAELSDPRSDVSEIRFLHGRPSGVIYAYTKDDAVLDGQQVAITQLPEEIGGYEMPDGAVIFITDSVYMEAGEAIAKHPEGATAMWAEIIANAFANAETGDVFMDSPMPVSYPLLPDMWVFVAYEQFAGQMRACITIMTPEDY